MGVSVAQMPSPAFLGGGGAMGARIIRTHDRAGSPLGVVLSTGHVQAVQPKPGLPGVSVLPRTYRVKEPQVVLEQARKRGAHPSAA